MNYDEFLEGYTIMHTDIPTGRLVELWLIDYQVTGPFYCADFKPRNL